MLRCVVSLLFLLPISFSHTLSEETAECDDDRQELLQIKSVVGQTTDAAVVKQPQPGSLVWNAFQELADEARAKLVAGAASGAQQPPQPSPDVWPVFSSVDVALPLRPPLIVRGGEKHIIEYDIKRPPCLVYGVGVARYEMNDAPDFEESIAKGGCETHAFDCTVKTDDLNVVNATFNFHPWCIGKDISNNLRDSNYVDDKSMKLTFKSLNATMAELGHSQSKIDLMKFDIEGSEWALFEDELLKSPSLPRQISFELHTEGANPALVPPEAVAGRDFVEVNKLFLALFDRGYRVISKEINGVDYHCAEFVVVNINEA